MPRGSLPYGRKKDCMSWFHACSEVEEGPTPILSESHKGERERRGAAATKRIL